VPAASAWLAVAAGALAVGAPSATAFVPKQGALLGGGRVGAVRTPNHLDVDFTTLRVSRDGKSLHFYGDWPAICGDGRVVTANIDRVVSIQRDGSFFAASLLPAATAAGTFELSGRLSRASIGGQRLEIASGTGRSDFALRTGRVSCKTPLVAWQVRSTPRVVGPPSPKKGATYFGSDDQTDPVVLRVSRDGRAIVQAGIEFGLDCRHTRFMFASDLVPGAAIRRDWSFSSTQRYRSAPGDARFGAGNVARFTAVLAGRFGASTVGGSLHVNVRIVGKGGAVVDTCRSATAFAASL
jgi:hypothetical protein